MEPIDYGGVLLKRWWLPVALGCICAVAAVLLIPGASKTPSASADASSWKWQASAIVGAPPPAAGSLSGLGSELSTEQIVFYAGETSVIEAAEKAVGFTQPANELTAYAAGPAPKTGIAGQVVLIGAGPTPAKAAAFTNAYAKALGDYINGLVLSKGQGQLQQVQRTINDLKYAIAADGSKAPSSLSTQLASAEADEQAIVASPSITGYQVIRPATTSGVARAAGKTGHGVTSSKKVRLLAGFVIGLIIGAGIVLISALLDKRLRNSSRAANNFGFPVVAEIPLSSKTNGAGDISALSSPSSSGSPVAEAFQMLRMAVILEDLAGDLVYDAGHPEAQPFGSTPIEVANLETDRLEPQPLDTRQVVLVVSPGEEVARPVVVANLAASYARAGLRVLVMSSLDVRMSEVVGTTTDSQDVTSVDLAVRMRPTLVENVSSVSMSEFVGNSAQLVLRAPGIIRAARELADVVIVEAPSLLAYHDAEALSSAVDVVLVVGDCMETKLERAKRAGELLRRMNAPVLGVVLTSVEIGTRDIRHLVSARPETKAVEEPLEGTLEPAPLLGIPGRDSETLEQPGTGNGSGGERETAPDREPETLELRNGNGNDKVAIPDHEAETLEHAIGMSEADALALIQEVFGQTSEANGQQILVEVLDNPVEIVSVELFERQRIHVPDRETETLELARTGNGHANGHENVAVQDLEPETLEHVKNGNGHENVAVQNRETETLEHAKNGNGNGKEKVAVPDREPETLEHAKNGNGNGNGNGHANGNGNGHAKRHRQRQRPRERQWQRDRESRCSRPRARDPRAREERQRPRERQRQRQRPRERQWPCQRQRDRESRCSRPRARDPRAREERQWHRPRERQWQRPRERQWQRPRERQWPRQRQWQWQRKRESRCSRPRARDPRAREERQRPRERQWPRQRQWQWQRDRESRCSRPRVRDPRAREERQRQRPRERQRQRQRQRETESRCSRPRARGPRAREERQRPRERQRQRPREWQWQRERQRQRPSERKRSRERKREREGGCRRPRARDPGAREERQRQRPRERQRQRKREGCCPWRGTQDARAREEWNGNGKTVGKPRVRRPSGA